jgi:catechol 2,3-dioxygenase-like lactoylglutathione lyase family enzyme
MVPIRAVAHFSIPVSDIAKSTEFYTGVVGCRHLSIIPNGQLVFLDAAGTCLILVKRNPPINPVPDTHGGVHHAFAIAHDKYQAASTICAPMASRSLLRRTGGAACSTGGAPIFTIPTAQCWNLSI